MPPPTPSTAPARSFSGGFPELGGSQTDLISIKKYIRCLDHFSIRLGIMLEPFCLPFCSILGHILAIFHFFIFFCHFLSKKLDEMTLLGAFYDFPNSSLLTKIYVQKKNRCILSTKIDFSRGPIVPLYVFTRQKRFSNSTST